MSVSLIPLKVEGAPNAQEEHRISTRPSRASGESKTTWLSPKFSTLVCRRAHQGLCSPDCTATSVDQFQSAKRKREEENKNSEEENEILALEQELLSQEVSIADAESALATETNKTSKLKMQTQNGESELRLVKRALVAKRAQAEASLQSSPEYMKLVASIGEAKVKVSAREEEQSNASRQLGELRGGLVQLTEGMSSQGHAPASALRILLKAPEPVPLQQLKTELTGHLSAVGLNKGREAQQVLEAIYSLTSSSLIHIDRKSAQQLVTPCV